MAKLRPNEQRTQISFQRPEDLRLYEFLKKRAYEARYDVGVFILVSLHEAFKGQIEDDEVTALAEEAARKVRGRMNFELSDAEAEELSLPGKTLPAGKYENGFTTDDLVEPAAKPQPLSMEQAQKQAEAQIAALDNLAATAMKKRVVRKGVPTPPPMPQ